MGKVVIRGDSTKEAPQGNNLIPEGEYELHLEQVEDIAAKSADKFPSTRVVMKTVESQDGRHVGRINSHFLSHSPNAASMVREFLENAGVPFQEVQVPTQSGMVTGVEFDTDDIPGKYVRARCYHDVYNNKTREKWTGWSPSKFSPQAQMGQQPGAQPQPPAAPPQVAHQAGQGQAPPRAMPQQGYPQGAPPPQQPPQAAPPQQGYAQPPQPAPQPGQPHPVQYPPQGNPPHQG